MTAAERRDQRRERLLEAGLELFGTQGYAETSVRAVSSAAGLNSRYFYESFASREELLCHVYERVVQEIAGAVVEVTATADTIEDQAREGVRAAWSIMTRDRRKARILAVEVVGVSERLERMRRRNRHAFADILLRNAFSLAGPDVKLRFNPVLGARAMIGASIELMVDWVYDELDVTVEEVVGYLTTLITLSATRRWQSRPARRPAQAAARAQPVCGRREGRSEEAPPQPAPAASLAHAQRPTAGVTDTRAPAPKDACRAVQRGSAVIQVVRKARRLIRMPTRRMPTAFTLALLVALLCATAACAAPTVSEFEIPTPGSSRTRSWPAPTATCGSRPKAKRASASAARRARSRVSPRASAAPRRGSQWVPTTTSGSPSRTRTSWAS